MTGGRILIVSLWFTVSGHLAGQTMAVDMLFKQIDKYMLCLEQQIGKATKFMSFDDQKDSTIFSRDDYESLKNILQGYRITEASKHHYQYQESPSRVIYSALNNQVRLRTLQIDRSGSGIVSIRWLYRSKSILGDEETTATLHCQEGFTLSTTDDKLWFGRHRMEFYIPFR